ncbi:MAG: oligosaccharide flippase family protein [Saprospiraceae bacterium]|nr:oligosaccharide flippase family protein [Saprospiraceae bacterium]
MRGLKSFFRDTVIYGIAAVLPRLISIALIPIFTKVLLRSEFSDQTTWYVYAAFINVFLTMGLETAFFRYYTKEDDKNKVLSSAFIILTISSATFALTGTLLASQICGFLGFNDPMFIKILVWTTALDTLVVIPFALLRVSNRPVKFMIFKIFNVLVWFTLTYIFLLELPEMTLGNNFFNNSESLKSLTIPGVFPIIVANLMASLITLILFLPEILKIKWSIEKSIIQKLLKYGWPIMIGGLAYVINENADKLIIQKLIDKNANGMYAACYKLGVFMTLYITAFRMGAEPFFFNHADTADATKKYSTIMTWFVIFGCIFMVFVVSFIDILAGILIRKTTYLPGLIIVPVILLANLFSGIYNNLAIWYKLTDRTRIGMYISISGAALTIILLFVLVPVFGIMGGAIATLITYVTMTCISYYVGNKHYPVGYEARKILTYLFMATWLCGLSFILFRGNYIMSILLIFLFILFILWVENLKLEHLIRVIKN